MCGIVGYLGSRKATDVVIAGLRKLEYRGYDSAGVAYLEPQAGTGEPRLEVVRALGRVDALAAKVDAQDSRAHRPSHAQSIPANWRSGLTNRRR